MYESKTSVHSCGLFEKHSVKSKQQELLRSHQIHWLCLKQDKHQNHWRYICGDEPPPFELRRFICFIMQNLCSSIILIFSDNLNIYSLIYLQTMSMLLQLTPPLSKMLIINSYCKNVLIMHIISSLPNEKRKKKHITA